MDALGYELGKLVSLASLEGQHCELFHIPSDSAENHEAVDYLCHQMGPQLPNGEIIADAELRVPICADCVDALISGEWVLIYCVHCGESRWVNKELSNREYPEDLNIIALKACPCCYKDTL